MDAPATTPPISAPLVAVSACLLGEPVRYDGGHRRSRVVVALAAAAPIRWLRICPEVEAGLGVPRPPLRLLRTARGLRPSEVLGGLDRGPALSAATARILAHLAGLPLRGLVLKSRSPSCAPHDAPRHAPDGAEIGRGAGVFASALRRAFPELPIEDEESLRNPDIRRCFLARIG